MALVVGSGRAMAAREGGLSQPPMARNAVERGPGGGLRRDGAGGLWRYKGWETLGSQTPTKTDGMCGGQMGSGAWAGTAHD